jgi:hypothetical protein
MDVDKPLEAQKLSEVIASAFDGETKGLTVGDLVAEAGRKGRGLLIVVVALPVAVPVTPPFLPPIFALLLLGMGLQIAIKRQSPWIPKWMSRREIKAKRDSKFVRFMVRLVQFFERFTKPRHRRFVVGPLFYSLVVPAIFVGAFGMLNPVPGMSVLPALGVFLIGMGMIEEDGGFAVFGSGLAVVGAAVSLAPYIAPFLLPAEQAQALQDWLYGLNPFNNS